MTPRQLVLNPSRLSPGGQPSRRGKRGNRRSWRLARLKIRLAPSGPAFGAYHSGTGFYYKLVMGSLAFPVGGCNADIRVAARLGSMTSAICGYLVVRSVLPRAPHI